MNIPFYRLACAVIRPIRALLYPLKVEGVENIPAEGGFIMCANHVSALDPVFIILSARHRHFHYMGKAEIFRNKLLAKLFYAIGVFPVERGQNDLNAVRTALKVVSEGHALGIFPQGTRAKDLNNPPPMLNGVSLIALRAGAPVIPAYIQGPVRMFRRTLLRFGKPVDISGFGRRCDNATMEQVTRAIADGIWNLAPEKKV